MKYLKLLILIAVLWIPTGDAESASFYTDLSGVCGGNGTATATPFCSLDEFADVARSAGDILFVRRGTATTTGITDLTFTSDGTLNNPIVMTADYDNIWGDFSTSSVTATVTQGSTTMPTSASTTDITRGDWIYIGGDCFEKGATAKAINPCEYAYEVATATPTYLEFYFPYKGFNNGSTKAIRRMPPNPIWNTVAGDFQWSLSADNSWTFKGFDIRGTDSVCNIVVLTSYSTKLLDSILLGNGATDCGYGAANPTAVVSKLRIFGTINGFNAPTANASLPESITNLLIDCNSVASSMGFNFASSLRNPIYVTNGEIRNCTNPIVGNNGGNGDGMSGTFFFRNVKQTAAYSNISGATANVFGAQGYFSDNFGSVGYSSTLKSYAASNALSTTTVATTTPLRAGGGASNLYVLTPSGTANTGISTFNFPNSFIKLFEYPIYSDGTSKTYTMYFLSASTSAFTVSPFTDTQSGSSTPELFIECEYYADPVDADRVTKRSNTASDVDFTSASWQDISVTCDPSQAGVLYLRGYYGKPKETPTNQFHMDTRPVVS